MGASKARAEFIIFRTLDSSRPMALSVNAVLTVTWVQLLDVKGEAVPGKVGLRIEKRTSELLHVHPEDSQRVWDVITEGAADCRYPAKA